MFKTVIPVWVVKSDSKDGIASKGQSIFTRCKTNHTVSGGMSTSAIGHHTRCHFALLIKQAQLIPILLDKSFGSCPERIRKAIGHVSVCKIRCFPELNFCGRHMNPQIRTQSFLYALDKKTTDMIHMHMGENHVSDRSKINTGTGQSLDQLSRARQVEVRIETQSSVDEDRLITATHYDHVQRPIKRIRWQIHIVKPFCSYVRVNVVPQHFGWKRQHTIADDQNVNLTDAQCIAGGHQFVGF